MSTSCRDLFKVYIKNTVSDALFYKVLAVLFIIILLLRLVFPLISDFIFTKTGFRFDNYYVIVSITMLSTITVLYGIASGIILENADEKQIMVDKGNRPEGRGNILAIRSIASGLICFVMLILGIIMTDPVPSEGWLRTSYIAFLLAVISLFFSLLTTSLSSHKSRKLLTSLVPSIVLLALPSGLLLHQPWNYIAFFSPLYWAGWAWVTSIPSEGFIYGTISLIITSACTLISFRQLLKMDKK